MDKKLTFEFSQANLPIDYVNPYHDKRISELLPHMTENDNVSEFLMIIT